MITCCACITNAQQLSFGLHGGYLTSVISHHPFYDNFHVGVNLGFNGQYLFNKHFAAYTEISYDQKGASKKDVWINTLAVL